MPYLYESRLSTYNSNLKEWVSSQDSKTITSSIYPWTKTVKAGVVSCYPVGGTELKPIVDFLFIETPPASGDKGPSNPSTITGVSSVGMGRIGKNLLLRTQGTASGYSISRNSDGSISISGSGGAFFSITDGEAATSGNKSSVRLDVSKSYTLSAECLSGTFEGSNTSLSVGFTGGTEYSFQLPSSGKKSTTFTPPVSSNGFFVCRIAMSNNAVFTNAVFRLQLEEGIVVTSFEPPMLPADADYTIQFGSTYYGGTLDVASGVMTVTWAGKILDGTEEELTLMSATADARLAYNIVEAGLPAPVGGYFVSLCSHSSIYNPANAGVWGEFCIRNSGYFMMQDKNHVIGTTVDTYRTWLSTQNANGTPVTFAYAITTPYTVQLTPTQILSLAQADKYTPRLNTLYTDASSVQVGYVKSPIREEYELTQAIVGQGGNI